MTDRIARVRSAVAARPWLAVLLLAAAVFVVYALTRHADDPYKQYVLLSDAFLHGRTYLIDPPSYLEVAKFGGHAYVIDPPAPTLFLLPVVAIFGTGADHVLVSSGVGALAIALLWIAARRLWSDRAFAFGMAVLIAFGTNFWWASSTGSLWAFAHVSAVFFSAAALVEATGRKRPWLVGIFLGLAGLSRLPVFLLTPLYAYLVLDGDLRLRRRNVQRLAALGGVLLVAVGVYFAYNWARYGTLKDLGYYHPQYAAESWFAKGRLDITYIPRHIEAIFFAGPHRTETFPYLRPSFIGLALFFTTPAFLYAFRARWNARNIAAIIALALAAVPLVTHGTTGWAQFGYRFSLDLLPPLLLLTASGMREQLDGRKLFVIGLCVLVNLWGVLSFNVFNWSV